MVFRQSSTPLRGGVIGEVRSDFRQLVDFSNVSNATSNENTAGRGHIGALANYRKYLRKYLR